MFSFRNIEEAKAIFGDEFSFNDINLDDMNDDAGDDEEDEDEEEEEEEEEEPAEPEHDDDGNVIEGVNDKELKEIIQWLFRLRNRR